MTNGGNQTMPAWSGTLFDDEMELVGSRPILPALLIALCGPAAALAAPPLRVCLDDANSFLLKDGLLDPPAQVRAKVPSYDGGPGRRASPKVNVERLASPRPCARIVLAVAWQTSDACD